MKASASRAISRDGTLRAAIHSYPKCSAAQSYLYPSGLILPLRRKKHELVGRINLDSPLAGLNAQLSTHSDAANRDAKVTISAYQFGGDISKLSTIIGGREGAQAFTECTLGSFVACSKVILGILIYASDPETGVPAQLSPDSEPGPAVLSYGVTPYEAFGIFDTAFPGLKEAVMLARDELSSKFETNYRGPLEYSSTSGLKTSRNP